jgi:DNA-binding MarR family transcriptional regulator
MIHQCPAHGPEYRDERFEVLNKLIALGYGTMPQGKIQELIEKHGTLDPRKEDDPDDEIYALRQGIALGQITQIDAVMKAVQMGYNTSTAIAARFEWDLRNTASRLTKLVDSGKLRVVAGGKDTKRQMEYEVVTDFQPKTRMEDRWPELQTVRFPKLKHHRHAGLLLAAVRQGLMKQIEAVEAAVSAGYPTAYDIAKLLCYSTSGMTTILEKLVERGTIRVIGKATHPKSGYVSKIYRPVEGAEHIENQENEDEREHDNSITAA